MTSIKPSKTRLITYILSYFFTAARFYILMYLLSALFPFIWINPYITILFIYLIAGYMAAKYKGGNFFLKLEPYLTAKQIRNGFIFIFVTLCIVTFPFSLMVENLDSSREKTTALLKCYILTPIITCIITVILSIFITKGQLLSTTEIVKEQFKFDRTKIELGIGVVVFFGSYIFFKNPYLAVPQILSIFFSLIITIVVLTIVRSFYFKEQKISLRARTVDESHVKYQKMNYDFNNESVMPTYDQHPVISETMHGKAAWITDGEKNILTNKGIDNKPNYEGLWLGGGFFHHQEGNLVSVAPPGTGKGAALIIPNLLWERKYKHSFVVFDPKGTNACITARFRKEQGNKVIIIDPMGLQQMSNANHGISSSCFNPLDHIKDDIFNGTSQIANLLLPDDPKSSDKYWSQDGRNLIQMILLHIMTTDSYIDRRNLITLHKIIVTGDFESLFQEMIVNRNMDGLIADNALGFMDMMIKTERTFSTVRSTASSSIKWLSNPALQQVLKHSDFNPRDLERGNITVYICQPISNKEGFATFSRLIIGFCLRANSMPSATSKAWVYYLLDEFPTMGVFPEVVEALAFSREYKMRLWIFAQSLSQLDSIYKVEKRHEIIGSATVLQAFGITDHITQEYISKRIGNQTVKFKTSSTSSSTGFGSSNSYGTEPGSGSRNESTSTSYNDAFQGKPLISSDELELDPNIITLTKWGPMRLVRWQYWQDINIHLASYYRQIFKSRADPNPNMTASDDEN